MRRSGRLVVSLRPVGCPSDETDVAVIFAGSAAVRAVEVCDEVIVEAAMIRAKALDKGVEVDLSPTRVEASVSEAVNVQLRPVIALLGESIDHEGVNAVGHRADLRRRERLFNG